MKKLYNYLLIGVFAILVTSCVDDFEDANPPRLLDAPELTGTQSADTVTGGDEVVFTLVVSDAPAGIDSVSVTGPEDSPIFTSNVASLLGQTKGTVEVKYVVPYTVSGAFEVTVSVWDNQTDSKGKDASKRFDKTFELVADYAFDAPTFNVSTDDASLFHNDSTKVTIEITSAPGGIGQVLAFSSLGSIMLSEESIIAADGQESAVITGMFYAPEREVGTATISVTVVDKLQKRESKGNSDVVIEYLCTAPDASLSVAQNGTTLGSSVEFQVDINSITACEIDTITLELKDDAGTAYGTLEYDEDQLDSLIDGTLSTMTGTFTAPASPRGVVSLIVTVTDKDYHSTELTEQITVIRCTPDYSGSYSTLASGTYGAGGVNNYANLASEVKLSPISCTQLRINDMSFGLYDAAYGEAAPDGILIINGNTITGDASNMDQYNDPFTINGTINSDGTWTIAWSNTYGDSGNVELTPL